MFAIARSAELRRPVARGPLATLFVWTERARQRRALAELPPERLRDLGLSQAQVRVETLKPFWRF